MVWQTSPAPFRQPIKKNLLRLHTLLHDGGPLFKIGQEQLDGFGHTAILEVPCR